MPEHKRLSLLVLMAACRTFRERAFPTTYFPLFPKECPNDFHHARDYVCETMVRDVIVPSG